MNAFRHRLTIRYWTTTMTAVTTNITRVAAAA